MIKAKQNTAWLNPGIRPKRGRSRWSPAPPRSSRSRADRSWRPTTSIFPPISPASGIPRSSVSEFGKGRVVYFAAAVDKGMFFYPDAYMRQMLANAVRWCAPTMRSRSSK